MSTWSSIYRRVTAPIRVEHTVPPADVVPLTTLLDGRDVDTAELEQGARTREMLRRIHGTLLAESLKPAESRNAALVNFCLDARVILQPSAPGSEVLREVPSVGIQRAVPVIPGRAA